MRFAYFMGHVVTAREDGSIPIGARLVAVKAQPDIDPHGMVLIEGEFLVRVLEALPPGMYESICSNRVKF